MIILILWIQKVRQRGHLICPRTAGKQQGQGWNQAGCPFHRLPLRGFPANLTGWLTYTIYFLDQISHYRELAFYTWSIVILWQFQHSYLYTSINPYGSSLFIRRKKKMETMLKREIITERTSKQSDESLTSSGWPWAFDGSQSAALELYS